MLFASYRRGDANDPDGYVAAIAAVLSMFDPALIREVTDPRTGISQSDFMDGRFRSFMPNSGELKAYCESIARHRERIARLGAIHIPKRLPPPIDTRPGRRANVFVPPEAPQYARCRERTKDADPADWKYDEQGRPGIWVALGWLHDIPRYAAKFDKPQAEAAE